MDTHFETNTPVNPEAHRRHEKRQCADRINESYPECLSRLHGAMTAICDYVAQLHGAISLLDPDDISSRAALTQRLQKAELAAFYIEEAKREARLAGWLAS